MTTALLTAAGLGTRMCSGIPKQFLCINDKPIIVYTMEAFQQSSLIDEIIVVTLSDWIEKLWEYSKEYGITKLRYVVQGGKTGQESILCGIKELSKYNNNDDVVIIHDGNRPMISQETISSGIEVYNRHGSAVAAIPCIEAIFKSSDGVSSNTQYPREGLYRTQTPHIYRLGELLWAHKMADEKKIFNTTATCVLMQMLGKEIYLSKGSEKNLKITTSEDIETFIAYLNVKERCI